MYRATTEVQQSLDDSSNNYEIARNTVDSRFSYPPPKCDEAELALAKKRFNRFRLRTMTSCPDASPWWDKYLAQTFFAAEYTPELRKQHEEPSRTLVGITLGCNKGDDAVDMLRKLSLNSTFSSEEFRKVFSAGNGGKVVGRACSELPPSPLDNHIQMLQTEHFKPNDAIVHCVEAMPNTATNLQETASSLSQIFANRFFVTHAAVGSSTGFLYFPSKGTGVEDAGLGNCAKDPETKPMCQKVPSFTIDDFVREKVLASKPTLEAAMNADLKAYEHLKQIELKQEQQQSEQDGEKNNTQISHSPSIWASYQPNFVVDWLSVDLEGYDWQGLGKGGAVWTLHHTGYLEFEYHGVGAWKDDKLSDAVEYLNSGFGFTCYWAGNGGWLGRITNCFQPHMEFHQWSNVACVNRYLRPHLAAQMENIYYEDLLKIIP